MSSGKAGRTPGMIFVVASGAILLVLPFVLAVVLFLRNGQQLSLPASAGLPDPAPVQLRPPPTAPPPQPTDPPAAQPTPAPTEPPPLAVVEVPPQPTPAPTELPPPAVVEVPLQPAEAPAQPLAPAGPPIFPSNVEPYPVDPGSTGSGSSTGSAAGAEGGSQVACGRRVVHVVKPGENLFRIALRYNTTIASIARRNGISDPRLVRSGQRLSIVTCR